MRPEWAEQIDEYLPETYEREWGTETFFARTKDYLGKILRMHAGTRGGLQCHVDKDETFYLLAGKAEVEYDDGEKLVTVPMKAGQSFHIPPKAPHRVTALTECVFLEASTLSLNDRLHCEAFYGLDEETGGLPSTFEVDHGEFRRIA